MRSFHVRQNRDGELFFFFEGWHLVAFLVGLVNAKESTQKVSRR
jgi:hypothetical protein